MNASLADDQSTTYTCFSHTPADCWRKAFMSAVQGIFLMRGAGWRRMTDHNDVELYQVFFGGEGDGLECWRICHPREKWNLLMITTLRSFFLFGNTDYNLGKSSSTKDYNSTERCQQTSVLHIAVTAARLWETHIRGGPHRILSGGWYEVGSQ